VPALAPQPAPDYCVPRAALLCRLHCRQQRDRGRLGVLAEMRALVPGAAPPPLKPHPRHDGHGGSRRQQGGAGPLRRAPAPGLVAPGLVARTCRRRRPLGPDPRLAGLLRTNPHPRHPPRRSMVLRRNTHHAPASAPQPQPQPHRQQGSSKQSRRALCSAPSHHFGGFYPCGRPHNGTTASSPRQAGSVDALADADGELEGNRVPPPALPS